MVVKADLWMFGVPLLSFFYVCLEIFKIKSQLKKVLARQIKIQNKKEISIAITKMKSKTMNYMFHKSDSLYDINFLKKIKMLEISK